MTHPYEDILYLPHHQSPSRKKMSMVDRAAQFSPFAALSGYEASIRETQRLTEEYSELSTDAIKILNEKMRHLLQTERESPTITVTYFVPDPRKQGGSYRKITERLKKVDQTHQMLLLENGMEIPFVHLYDLQGDFLDCHA